MMNLVFVILTPLHDWCIKVLQSTGNAGASDLKQGLHAIVFHKAGFAKYRNPDIATQPFVLLDSIGKPYRR